MAVIINCQINQDFSIIVIVLVEFIVNNQQRGEVAA